MEKLITVEQVHQEFKEFPTHLSMLLQDMDLNLAKDKKVYQKASLLKGVGFTNANQGLRNPEDVFNETKEEHDAIAELCLKYPAYKFISRKGIEHLCNKYGLSWGMSEHFIGQIPEKNMDELLASQDQDFDFDVNFFIELEISCKAVYNKYGTDSIKAVMFDLDTDGKDVAFSKQMLQYYILEIAKDHLSQNGFSSSYLDVKLRNSKGKVYARHKFRPTFDSSRRVFSFDRDWMRDMDETSAKQFVSMTMDQITRAVEKVKDLVSSPYSIIANKEDFSKLVHPEDATIEMETPVLQLPDPVIVKKTYKEGYYAIITAWDKEAMDPLVFNQKLN